MKKRRLAPLLLAAPLTLLCACGGTTPSLAINANWYANTENSSNITGTHEALSYEVTFEKAANSAFSYKNGSFTTLLEDVNYSVGDELQMVYHLHTELTLPGECTIEGETEEFEDYAVSDVWFYSAKEGLSPLRSAKKFHTTFPASVAEGESDILQEYEYEYTVEYELRDSRAAEAHAVWKDLKKDGEERKKDISLGNGGSFFDNEQIFFALRGLTPAANTAFRTLDPQTDTEVGMTISDTESVDFPVSFTVNGAEIADKTITANQIRLRYSLNQPGPTRTLVYAAVTQPNNNTYRSVLLRFDNPVLWSTSRLGTLTYLLKTAEFNSK